MLSLSYSSLNFSSAQLFASFVHVLVYAVYMTHLYLSLDVLKHFPKLDIALSLYILLFSLSFVQYMCNSKCPFIHKICVH